MVNHNGHLKRKQFVAHYRNCTQLFSGYFIRPVPGFTARWRSSVFPLNGSRNDNITFALNSSLAYGKQCSVLAELMNRSRCWLFSQTVRGSWDSIDVSGRGGIEACETSRLPHLFRQLTYGNEVISLTRRPPFNSPGSSLILISIRGWVYPRALVWLEGLGKLKMKWPHRESNPRPSSSKYATACLIYIYIYIYIMKLKLSLV
jgi:hypothetical protein